MNPKKRKKGGGREPYRGSAGPPPAMSTAPNPDQRPVSQPEARPTEQQHGRSGPLHPAGSATKPSTQPVKKPESQSVPKAVPQPPLKNASQPAVKTASGHGHKHLSKSVMRPETHTVRKPVPQDQRVSQPNISAQPAAKSASQTSTKPVQPSKKPASQEVKRPVQHATKVSFQLAAKPPVRSFTKPPFQSVRKPVSQPAAKLSSQAAAKTSSQRAAHHEPQSVTKTVSQNAAGPASQHVTSPSRPVAQPAAKPASHHAASPPSQPATQPASRPTPAALRRSPGSVRASAHAVGWMAVPRNMKWSTAPPPPRRGPPKPRAAVTSAPSARGSAAVTGVPSARGSAAVTSAPSARGSAAVAGVASPRKVPVAQRPVVAEGYRPRRDSEPVRVASGLRTDRAPTSSGWHTDEDTWDDDPLPPVGGAEGRSRAPDQDKTATKAHDRPLQTRTVRENKSAAEIDERSRLAGAKDKGESVTKSDAREPLSVESVSEDSWPSGPEEGSACGEETVEGTGRPDRTMSPAASTIKVTVKFSPAGPPGSQASADTSEPGSPLDENANWVCPPTPASTLAHPERTEATQLTDGEAWFQRLVSETVRGRLSTDHRTEKDSHCVSPRYATPSKRRREGSRRAAPPRRLSEGEAGVCPGRRPAPRPRTVFQPSPGDQEMAGLFFQSQEDLATPEGRQDLALQEREVVAERPQPISPGSIPLPPGSPLSHLPGFPRPGPGRLPGGAPTPGFQPEGFAVRQWPAEDPQGRNQWPDDAPAGRDQWPSLEEVAGRVRQPQPRAASQLTIQEAVRYNEDGGWWSEPPPPPPPPPEPSQRPPGVPGRPLVRSASARDATLDDVLRSAPIDWWEGGPTVAADRPQEVALGEVERPGDRTAEVASAQVSTHGVTVPSLPRHLFFDDSGRPYPAPAPPPPAGRGAWRPLSPPAPAAAPGFTPRALAAREPLSWHGRGLSRSEPRPGQDGFRARYVPPEERVGAVGGGRRSVGGMFATVPAEDKCGPDAIAAFRRRMSRSAGYGTPYDVDSLLTTRLTVGFIDSHCHLDFLFKRDQPWGSGRPAATLAEYRRRVAGSFPPSFAGCIAVFCDPNYWHRRCDWGRIVEEPGVWAAFGCHPHSVRDLTMQDEELLTHILTKHRSVVALGEIGLDYSLNNNTGHELQKTVFRRQLALGVSLGLPLVLHVRDAEEDALQIALEMVPRGHLIHRHCITGNWPMVRRWMEAFPNCYVGLTPLITNPSACDARFVAGEVPLDRLLLETDAPYFLPHCYRRDASEELRFSHPGLALHVAAQMAHMRRVPLPDLVRITAQNTRTMYRLPAQQTEVNAAFCAD